MSNNLSKRFSHN